MFENSLLKTPINYSSQLRTTNTIVQQQHDFCLIPGEGYQQNHTHTKKKTNTKCRDRFIGSVNQNQFMNSFVFNPISKQKNLQKSHKISFQNSAHTNINQINHLNSSNHNFQSPQNTRAIRARLQQLQTNLNNANSYSAAALSPLETPFSTVLSLTNLSIPTGQQHNVLSDEQQPYSSTTLQNNRQQQIATSQNYFRPAYYSTTNMDQEDYYDQDEIIEESREIQEELQDEQTCKYIELLKRGVEESPLSKNSPFLNRGCETAQKKKIITFSANDNISEEMRQAFSLHSLTNLTEKGSNFFLQSSEIVQHESLCNQSGFSGKQSNSRGNLFNNNSQAPLVVDTIQLVSNMIEDDFYQNILDWSMVKKIAAMAEKQIIHLTDFKTQEKDALLSSNMQNCNIDYLPLLDKLPNQQIGSNNFNSFQSWSIISSTQFLSSQKKRNNQQQSGRYDTVQLNSSNSLQAYAITLQSQNNLYFTLNEETQSQNEETEGSEIGNLNEYDESKKNDISAKNSANKSVIQESNIDVELDDQKVNISSFNLNTPSPNNQENKQQYSYQSSNQLTSQSLFPNIISPIIPNSKSFYSVLKFSSSGHILVAGRCDGVIEVYDVEKKIPIFVARCHSKLITSISINKTFIATASQDSKVVIFDIRDLSNIILFAYLSSRNSSSILSLEWSPVSQNTLAASTESGHINLYNILKDNKCSYKEFKLRESSIKTFAWHPSKRGILIAGCLDGTLFVIDLEEKKIFQRKKILNHIYKIIFSPNQNDRFVCLTGHQSEINNQIRNNANSQNNLNTTQINMSNQEIINDILALQQGSMFVLSYPEINKIHQVEVGEKRACQGILSHDGSNIYTLTKENVLKQWKVFKEPQQQSVSSSLLSSAQELR